jgi:hypothetical protein
MRYVVTEPEDRWAAGRAEETGFFPKKCTQSTFLGKRINKYHSCRRRFCRSSGETLDLDSHRVPRVIYPTYAVPDQAGHSASGRAEDIMLFHKNVALCATFL